VEHLKVSLITVTYNAQKTLGRCIQSVAAQKYAHIEHIIIDGASTDDTLQIINQYKSSIDFFVSEPDAGIYDAMNKGIRHATGDVIGILNADDYLAADNVIDALVNAFEKENAEVVYGNLNYLNSDGNRIRIWDAGNYKHGMFNWGWMPPHPTFYCRRGAFKSFGLYDLDFGTAADYELMLRFLHVHKVSAFYLNKVMVNMAAGGVSNKSFINRVKAWKYDFKAMVKNGVISPYLCLIFKPLRKIFQFI
jgi:glycosyltransferase involved in cell wall biosynthesis